MRPREWLNLLASTKRTPMQRASYVVVELRTVDERSDLFASRHPAVTVDQLVTTDTSAKDPVYTLTAFVSGLVPGETQALLDELEAAALDVTTYRRDDEAGTWFGTYRLPAVWLADPAAVAISEFMAAHGLEARWTRTEQGHHFVKLLVPEEHGAHEVAARFRGFLEGRGVDADIGVELSSSEGLGPWQALVSELRHEGVPLPPGLAGVAP